MNAFGKIPDAIRRHLPHKRQRIRAKYSDIVLDPENNGRRLRMKSSGDAARAGKIDLLSPFRISAWASWVTQKSPQRKRVW